MRLSLIDGRNVLCVTTEILSKYAEIIEQKSSTKFAELALSVITNNPYTLFVTPYYHFKLIAADPDDDKFVDCAVASNAKFVVNEDKHYDVLQDIDFPRVDVIKLDEIIQII